MGYTEESCEGRYYFGGKLASLGLGEGGVGKYYFRVNGINLITVNPSGKLSGRIGETAANCGFSRMIRLFGGCGGGGGVI